MARRRRTACARVQKGNHSLSRPSVRADVSDSTHEGINPADVNVSPAIKTKVV